MGGLESAERQFWFAIAKGGLKTLDRIGQASSDGYFLFSEAELLRFVDFDIYNNNVFTMGPIILKQGANGVPIGGFVLAQLAELWAMWRDAHLVFDDFKSQTTLLVASTMATL